MTKAVADADTPHMIIEAGSTRVAPALGMQWFAGLGYHVFRAVVLRVGAECLRVMKTTCKVIV